MGFTIKHGPAGAQKIERNLKPTRTRERLTELERAGVPNIQVLNQDGDPMGLEQLKRDLNGGVR